MDSAARGAGPRIAWAPNPGSQQLFLKCPIFEVLLEGSRGGGKSDVLLMDFAQFVGRGFGPAWRGILFRQTYPNLEEVIAKGYKWFPKIFPGTWFNAGKYCWRFPTGEVLYLRHAAKEHDYYNYHGFEMPWIGWEELTNWADDRLYMMMMSICRSSDPRVPRHYRSTTNPFGRGHNWVKGRFIDPAPRLQPIRDRQGRLRVAIHSMLDECPQLSLNDPDYVKNLQALDGPKRAAWLEGRWDIVAGGMFDDVWDARTHVLEPFPVPPSWYIDRSFDWGSSRPYSVGWWAESDGTDIVYPDGSRRPTQRGDLFRIAELYGWTGKANEGTRELAAEVARKIRGIEQRMGMVVHPGPADSAIFSRDNGNSIADDMGAQGVHWRATVKDSHSRQNGWELMRSRLKSALNREGPGLHVFNTCRQFIRTVPVLPRDERDMDDVDTAAEDHVGDEVRYRVLAVRHVSEMRQF